MLGVTLVFSVVVCEFFTGCVAVLSLVCHFSGHCAVPVYGCIARFVCRHPGGKPAGFSGGVSGGIFVPVPVNGLWFIPRGHTRMGGVSFGRFCLVV